MSVSRFVNARFAYIPVIVLSGTTNGKFFGAAMHRGKVRHPETSPAKEVSEKIGTFVRYWFSTVELL